MGYRLPQGLNYRRASEECLCQNSNRFGTDVIERLHGHYFGKSCIHRRIVGNDDDLANTSSRSIYLWINQPPSSSSTKPFYVWEPVIPTEKEDPMHYCGHPGPGVVEVEWTGLVCFCPETKRCRASRLAMSSKNDGLEGLWVSIDRTEHREVPTPFLSSWIDCNLAVE